jgi:ParB family chromosome partitioning protein
VVVKLKSVIAGEWAENEFRKQFTPSERKAIAEAVEDELLTRERRGRPAKNVPDSALLNRGKTRDIAAAKVGFKHSTYEQVKTVTDRGVPELVEAMDSGEIKIDAAAKIATQPKADQERIVRMPKDEQREVVRQIRKTKADKELDERRARDIRLFMGLYNAVKSIGDFHEEPGETWAGLWRVSGYDFSDHLDRAIEYLTRLKNGHPNETKRPFKVS